MAKIFAVLVLALLATYTLAEEETLTLDEPEAVPEVTNEAPEAPVAPVEEAEELDDAAPEPEVEKKATKFRYKPKMSPFYDKEGLLSVYLNAEVATFEKTL